MKFIIPFIAMYALLVSTPQPGFSGSLTTNDTTPEQSNPHTIPETQAVLDHLFLRLQQAESEAMAREIENKIWRTWMASPQEEIQNLIDQAMAARRAYNFKKAIKILDIVVRQAPDYAEGWNQRAFVLFLQKKYDQSLSDLEHALQLEPRHFGAMAGQARILMQQGRFITGQKILEQAVKIHPFLRERNLINDSGIVDTGEIDL